MRNKSTIGRIMDDVDDEEDLLKNFDGIPRFSIVELLEQSKETITN